MTPLPACAKGYDTVRVCKWVRPVRMGKCVRAFVRASLTRCEHFFKEAYLQRLIQLFTIVTQRGPNLVHKFYLHVLQLVLQSDQSKKLFLSSNKDV